MARKPRGRSDEIDLAQDAWREEWENDKSECARTFVNAIVGNGINGAERKSRDSLIKLLQSEGSLRMVTVCCSS